MKQEGNTGFSNITTPLLRSVTMQIMRRLFDARCKCESQQVRMYGYGDYMQGVKGTIYNKCCRVQQDRWRAMLLRNREAFQHPAHVFLCGSSLVRYYVIRLDRCNFQEALENAFVSVVEESPERSTLPHRIGQTSKPLHIHARFLKAGDDNCAYIMFV